MAEAAAIEAVIGAPLEFASRAESPGWNENTAQLSSAVFGLGLRKSDQCAYSSQVGSTEDIQITISVLPEPGHINQAFKIFLVAQLPEGLFSLNALGQFVPFTGAVGSLAPFKQNLVLTHTHEFTAFSGVLNEALAFDLYIGYQTEAGDFVYTASPIPMRITH